MQKRSRWFGFTLAMMAGLTGAASGAEFELLDGQDPSRIVVRMHGLIAEGDFGRFLSVTAGATTATLILNGSGGLFDEAMRIGAEIQRRGFATMVSADGVCFSACALVWIAGSERYMARAAQIGFHDTYVEYDGLPRRAGLQSPAVGEYLIELGLGEDAVDFVTHPPPDDVTFLTPMLARGIGINVYLQTGDTVVTPEQAPTFEGLVAQAAAFTRLGGSCRSVFEYDDIAFQDGAERVRNLAAEFVDERTFDVIVAQWVEVADANQPNPLRVCLGDIEELHAAGRSVLPAGPRFDCSQAEDEFEVVICADAELAMLDRIVGELNQFTVLGEEGRQQLARDQQQWIDRREECGGDAECLGLAYRQRIDELVE